MRDDYYLKKVVSNNSDSTNLTEHINSASVQAAALVNYELIILSIHLKMLR